MKIYACDKKLEMLDRLDYEFDLLKKILSIEWNLGNTCTYTCHYCDPDLYSGSKPWVDFEQTKTFIDRAQQFASQNNKDYVYWQFSGGEPTVYRDFLKLINYISSKENNVCSVVSNGSRSLRYWEQASKSLLTTVLSVHLDYANIEHIRNVADLLTDHDVIVNVLVMMDPKNWDKGVDAVNYMLDSRRAEWCVRTSGLTYRTQELIDRPYSYTKEQLDYLADSLKRPQKIVRKNFPFANIRRTMLSTTNGVVSKFDAAKAVINDQSKWSGYQCNIGIDRLYIHNDGSLKLGAGCRMETEGFTGKKFYEDFEFPKSSILCQQERCSCLSDVLVEKWLDKK